MHAAAGEASHGHAPAPFPLHRAARAVRQRLLGEQPGCRHSDRRIAFTAVRARGQRGIALATSDRHDERVYLNGAVDEPARSPNGASFACERANPGAYTDIVFVRVADGSPSR